MGSVFFRWSWRPPAGSKKIAEELPFPVKDSRHPTVAVEVPGQDLGEKEQENFTLFHFVLPLKSTSPSQVIQGVRLACRDRTMGFLVSSTLQSRIGIFTIQTMTLGELKEMQGA